MTNAPRWLNQDEQRTWRAFLSANQLLFDALERQLHQDAAMPHGYYEILVRLSEAPGHRLRMSELAEKSISSRSRVSHAAKRLEAVGWLRREDCAEDRRGSWAVMTPEGYEALKAAAPGHVEAVRTHLFDQLTPEQVRQLRDISEAIVAHLDPEQAT